MLSNILNNAYEALSVNGKITLNLTSLNSHLQLQIVDNGRGIPSNKINDVLNGLSLKHPGSGLGLSSTKHYMEKLKGKLLLTSIYNHETTVTLVFPESSKPSWLPEQIRLTGKTIAIILDDDASIHNLWRQRLQSHDIHSQHFSCSEDVFKWYENNKATCNTAIYLIDYVLRNDPYTGIETLQKLNVKEHGYLITGHADVLAVQQGCEQLGVWLIPKSMVGDIKLKLENVIN